MTQLSHHSLLFPDFSIVYLFYFMFFPYILPLDCDENDDDGVCAIVATTKQ